MNRRAWILLLVLGAIWGASYLLIKIGLRDLSPAMVAFLRVALAALVLVALAGGRTAMRGFGDRIGTLVVVAAVQVAGPFLLIAAGELQITSSLAGILVTAAPLFTALLAIWVDHEERSHGTRLFGVILGVVGVATLLGVDLGGSGDQLLGGLAVVLAALGYAIGGLVVKRRLGDRPPIGVAAWIVLASTVLLLPFAAAGFPASAPGLGPLAAVIVLGVVGTGIAFAILFHLIATVGPARTWVVSYIAPGFAVVYGALLLSEPVTPVTLAGLSLILIGSYLAAEDRGSLRSRRRRGVASGGGQATQEPGGPVAIGTELAPERLQGR